MVVDLLPCPFCGGRDVSLSSVPDLESRFRVTCNTCRVFIIDDRRDKVHDKWNTRNITLIGTHVFYRQPTAIDGMYQALSDLQIPFDKFIEKLSQLKAPPNNDQNGWESTYDQMHDLLLHLKMIDTFVKTKRTDQRKRNRQKKNQSRTGIAGRPFLLQQ